jgi:hypothetical protein
VIQQFNPKNFSRIFNPFRNRNIFMGRFGITGRMIMEKDDAGGI